jgi:multiple sugar transport system substrate-binding protein
MMMDGSWSYAPVRTLDFAVGTGVPPKVKDLVTPMHAAFWVIYVDTPHPDAAWQLLRFLNLDEFHEAYVGSGKVLPSHASFAEDTSKWLNPEIHQPGYERIYTMLMQDYGFAITPPAGYAEGFKAVTDAMADVWLGERTAEEALTESVPEANRILEEYRLGV